MSETPTTPVWDQAKFYADPSDVAERLGVPADDKTMLRRLAGATERFTSDIGRSLHLSTEDYYASGDGGRTLHLPFAPIHGTPTVEIDGQPVTGVEVGRRTGILRLAGGWPYGLENVRVEVTHGYETIPGDVQDVILEAVDAAHELQVGVESIGTGGENVKFNAGLVNGGVTAAWARVAEKYRLSWNGDGE